MDSANVTKRKLNQSDSLTREELLNRITELEKQNEELKEHLATVQQNELHSQSTQSTRKAKKNNVNEPKSKKRKAFDFSRYNVRHVALKIAYLGWDYHGFASQENIENTIEAYLFNALQKSCLIEDRSTCNYSRCGRTDKGVSAFGQVISLEVRSNLDEGYGLIQKKNATNTCDDSMSKDLNKEEINYVYVLNKLLPDEIRVLAWMPVALDFRARFSCLYRMYRYYFPAGDFDIQRMNEAGKKFVGEHDFRNFCKMDVGNNVTSFCRNILSVDVQRMYNSWENNEYEMCVITVKGMAFLWHQVRCMVAILFLIGQHLEQPQIIDHMLDITKCPRRPQYNMASEIPLVLFNCEYEGITWKYDTDELQRISNSYQRLWTTSSIKTTMMRELLDGLHKAPPKRTEDKLRALHPDSVPSSTHEDKTIGGMSLIPGHHVKSYKKILNRALCDSLETKLENLSAKQQRLRKKIS